MPPRPTVLLGLLSFLLALTPARAQGPRAAAPQLDVFVTIESFGNAPERVGVAYGGKVTDAQMREDIAALAQALGQVPQAVKIQHSEGIATVEAELPGLTNWAEGSVNLDALITTFRRYGYFRVLAFFVGSAKVQPVETVNRPPVRVEGQSGLQGGIGTVQFRVWVDQTGGVPESVPSVTGTSGPGWRGIAGLIAIAVVVAAALFLIVSVVLGQRRSAAARQGKA